MEKITKKQMIERLTRFRAASDQINDDLNRLSEKVLMIYQLISVKPDKTPEEEEVSRQLQGLVEPILESTLHSHNYNDSMWKDYTLVIKALGASNDVKNNGD